MFFILSKKAMTFFFFAPSQISWMLKLDHCRAKFKQKQTEQVLFINNNLSILFAVSCVSAASLTITQSLLPSRAISWTVLELTRFIYSCKSYFKWLTSKRLVYRAKWRAASPFKAASVFISSPQNWDAEWGEFNLYENTSALQAHSQI